MKEDYRYHNNELTECSPNYEEQIAKELQWLKDAGATIKTVEVPEDLRKFNISLSYDYAEKNPYEVVIPDNMPMWGILDTLNRHKDVINHLRKREMETVNTKELLKKLDI